MNKIVFITCLFGLINSAIPNILYAQACAAIFPNAENITEITLQLKPKNKLFQEDWYYNSLQPKIWINKKYFTPSFSTINSETGLETVFCYNGDLNVGTPIEFAYCCGIKFTDYARSSDKVQVNSKKSNYNYYKMKPIPCIHEPAPEWIIAKSAKLFLNTDGQPVIEIIVHNPFNHRLYGTNMRIMFTIEPNGIKPPFGSETIFSNQDYIFEYKFEKGLITGYSRQPFDVFKVVRKVDQISHRTNPLKQKEIILNLGTNNGLSSGDTRLRYLFIPNDFINSIFKDYPYKYVWSEGWRICPPYLKIEND